MRGLASRLSHAPIRILQIVEGLEADAGDPSRCVPYQCLAISSPDFQVDLAFPETKQARASEVDHLQTSGIGLHPFSRSNWIKRLPSLVQRSDIVHYNGLWSPLCPWVARLAARTGRPMVLTPHGMLEPWVLEQNALRKRAALALAYRKALNATCALHATVRSEAGNLRRLGLSQPIAVIANAVVVPDFESSIVATAASRRILFLSRIHPKKGLLELVRAVRHHQAQLERGEWRLVVAGSDADGHWAEVEQEAEQLAVRHLIDYVGYVDGQQKWDLYRSASLFVLPTHRENFGVVVAEALGSGVPCITTQGAPWQELNTQHCGWWHDVGQTQLQNALGEALSTPPEALQEMGQRGMALVRARHRIEALSSDFHDLYYWVLHRAEEPRCFSE